MAGSAAGSIWSTDAQCSSCGKLAAKLLPQGNNLWRQGLPHPADALARSEASHSFTQPDTVGPAVGEALYKAISLPHWHLKVLSDSAHALEQLHLLGQLYSWEFWVRLPGGRSPRGFPPRSTLFGGKSCHILQMCLLITRKYTVTPSH